jgi:hypothetical protein
MTENLTEGNLMSLLAPTLSELLDEQEKLQLSHFDYDVAWQLGAKIRERAVAATTWCLHAFCRAQRSIISIGHAVNVRLSTGFTKALSTCG